jgi:hypothetical protein
MQDELPQATVTRGKTQCGKHIVTLFDLHAGNTVQLTAVAIRTHTYWCKR